MKAEATPPPQPPRSTETLLDVTDLVVTLGGVRRGWSKRASHPAVDGVSFSVRRGHTLGLIGESGSGKTTVCKTLAGLIKPTAGRATIDGHDLLRKGGRSKSLKRRVQMVFQDPFASLDPGVRVGELVREPLKIHGIGSRREQQAKVRELLDLVGLPEGFANRFPHQMSGGQLQRVSIARALALGPDVVLADEPLSALDVSIQAQVSNLLMRLQRELAVSFLFVGHDLAAIRRLSDDIAVMYRGRIVEMGSADDVYGSPRHPYTVALMSAIPQPTTQEKQKTRIAISVSQAEIGNGCRYRDRCWLYKNLGEPEQCQESEPVGASSVQEHYGACHFSGELSGQPEYDKVLRGASLA